MRHIIMCGGKYEQWETPRQLLEINGEEIVARTIRLLKEQGVKDIAISSHDPAFLKFGIPVLGHKNQYYDRKHNDHDGYWCSAFYPSDEPTCYLFGDVVFSPEAIKKIVKTRTKSIDLFGSAPPFAENYPKPWVEPFAFKVVDTKRFKEAIQKTKELEDAGNCWRKPIAWELWDVIQGRNIDKRSNAMDYIAINDYTCDIDYKYEIPEIEKVINGQA